MNIAKSEGQELLSMLQSSVKLFGSTEVSKMLNEKDSQSVRRWIRNQRIPSFRLYGLKKILRRS